MADCSIDKFEYSRTNFSAIPKRPKESVPVLTLKPMLSLSKTQKETRQSIRQVALNQFGRNVLPRARG